MAILMEEGEEEEEGVVGTDNAKAESVPAESTPEAQVTRDASALHRLEALTIHAPSRAVLDALPAWLSKLSGTQRELHLLVGQTLFMHLQSRRLAGFLAHRLSFRATVAPSRQAC